MGSLHNGSLDLEVTDLEVGRVQIAAGSTIFHGNPTGPLGRVDHGPFAPVLAREHTPVLSARLRLEVVGSNPLAIADGGPSTVVAVLNAHVEAGLSVVVVVRAAPPRCAAVVTGSGAGVEGGGPTAVSVGLDPVNLDAPRLIVIRAVAVVSAVVLTADVGRDGVDIRVHARAHAGKVDIKLDISAKQVVSRLGSHTTVARDTPSSVHQLGRTVGYHEIPRAWAVLVTLSRFRGWSGDWAWAWVPATLPRGGATAAAETLAAVINPTIGTPSGPRAVAFTWVRRGTPHQATEFNLRGNERGYDEHQR